MMIKLMGLSDRGALTKFPRVALYEGLKLNLPISGKAANQQSATNITTYPLDSSAETYKQVLMVAIRKVMCHVRIPTSYNRNSFFENPKSTAR